MSAEELDDIVQGLAEAKYALEADDARGAGAAVDATLAKARALLTRQALDDGALLRRTRPSTG